MTILKILNNYIQLNKYIENMIIYSKYNINYFLTIISKYYHVASLSYDCLYNLLKYTSNALNWCLCQELNQ